MVRCAARAVVLALAAQFPYAAFAEVTDSPEPASTDAVTPPDAWVDRMHGGVHAFLWRSAMHVDRWFGNGTPDKAYEQQTRGSITPIMLWDEFNGLEKKLRFRVHMPLPQLGERFNAFLGTFTRDEFVTEREQPSGAIPRQRAGGQVEEDQTLLGIAFRPREEDDHFDADFGVRIRSPLDPFVKAGYRNQLQTTGGTIVRFRETAFWQNSEKFGATSRIDVERSIAETWLARWTASGTISQKTQGVRGYAALTVYGALADDRAFGAQIFSTGEFDAAVPVGEYGIRVAFRQQILRDWLVLELRPSLTWPKNDPDEPREPSWGIGVGFEMFFGVHGFEARPATF